MRKFTKQQNKKTPLGHLLSRGAGSLIRILALQPR